MRCRRASAGKCAAIFFIGRRSHDDDIAVQWLGDLMKVCRHVSRSMMAHTLIFTMLANNIVADMMTIAHESCWLVVARIGLNIRDAVRLPNNA